ncbi:MAG TPA: DUF92 domain-containing protein [Gemmatimonadaceae bacterium]|nr:DUF92 domain-containing protein [Gemmatimonadaceae bacterium]
MPQSLTIRIALGAALVIAVAAVARRANALTAGGALAAVVVGTCAVAAGWEWAGVLLFFFLTSTSLTRLHADVKEARGAARMEKTGARDAVQVYANGGAFAAAAFAHTVLESPVYGAAALGAIAAATADTWATEIGMLAPQTPRSILTGRPVPPGTSGGVTTAGWLAGCMGALSIACVVTLMRLSGFVALVAAAGGITGMFVDSVLGAGWQARYRCERCDVSTERTTHSCGMRTKHEGGLRWLNNDAVNFLSTIAGAAVAAFACMAAASL